MADTDWEFIYDGVIGFLTSPMWQIPLMSFIEKHCIVFDPSEENCHSWKVTHQEYKTLVENLLSSYLKDVGITEEQFVQACSAPAVKARPQMQIVFEQIWAAEDFEIYKRLMVQRNIELELQALHLIQQQQSFKQQANQSQPPQQRPQLFTEEDEILKEVLRHSKLEYEMLQKSSKGDEEKSVTEIEREFADSHEDNVKILAEKAVEKKKEMKQAVAERIMSTQPEKSSAGPKEPKKQETETARELKAEAPAIKNDNLSAKAPPVKKLPELAPAKTQTSVDAAASWLISAKSEISNSSTNNSAAPTEKQDTDFKRREEYLKQQRDKLLALKNKERETRLDTYTEKQPKRPTSARVAREAVKGNSNSQASKTTDTKTSGMSKALAERLKKEVLHK